jgi:hypothetical protein
VATDACAVIRTKGFYFPWLVLAFNFLMGADPTPYLLGYLTGAVFHLLAETLPQAGPEWGLLSGLRIMYTPKFMYSLVGEAPLPEAGFPNLGGGGGAFVGQGRALGGGGGG